MIEYMTGLEGKKVYINFDAHEYIDNEYYDNHAVQYYTKKGMKIDKIKSIVGRINWVFKYDLTIPLKVFDQMIGINMDDF